MSQAQAQDQAAEALLQQEFAQGSLPVSPFRNPYAPCVIGCTCASSRMELRQCVVRAGRHDGELGACGRAEGRV